MSKPIETLIGADAIAFQDAIGPHVDAVADALGIARLGDLSSAASGNGSALVSFVQNASGAINRTVEGRLRDEIKAKDFGAIGDGVPHTVAEWIIPGVRGRYVSLAALQVDYPHVTATTNCLNWAALQAAANYGMHLGEAGGATVEIARGKYYVTGTVRNDRSGDSSLGVVDFIGAGRRATWIIHHNWAGPLFYAKGHATEIAKQTTDLCYARMTLLGSHLPGQIAIQNILCSDPHYSDLHIEGFDLAYDLEDVDQAVIHANMIQFNKRAIYARQKAAPVNNSTQPNQFVLVGVTIMNNGVYGIKCNGGSNWTILGGVVSTNGQDDNVNGFGVLFENCGYQGGPVVVCLGTNFESNNGKADVILRQVAASAALTQCTYAFPFCSFNRTSNTIKATNVILMDFASAASVGEQIVIVDGSVFKSLGEYTPSSARPYLNWVGEQVRTARNFLANGTIFEDALERPAFIQNIAKPFIQLSKAANQSIPNGTPTIWPIDTMDKGFSWTGAINGAHQVEVLESGLYALSAHHIFTSTPGGTVRIEILLNGAMAIASNTVSGADAISTYALVWLDAGALISVRSTQNSGAAVTLAGSASANSRLSIMKMVDV